MKHNHEKEINDLEKRLENGKAEFYFQDCTGKIEKCIGTQNLNIIPKDEKHKIWSRGDECYFIKEGNLLKIEGYYKDVMFAYYDFTIKKVVYLNRRRIIPNEEYLEDLITFAFEQSTLCN